MADDILTDGGPDSSPSDGAKTDTGADSGKQDTGIDTGIDTGDDSGDPDSGVDADDAQADVKPPLDSGSDGSVCMLGIGFGSISMQGCTLGQDWTCGNDKYEFDCACPGAMCKCSKNGQLVQTVQSPNGCPKCTFNGASIASLCGFPY